LSVLLGTILAAAVLTGSLLVGDSVDGSLRAFALQRLGKIQYAMHTPNRFFSASVFERESATSMLQVRGLAMSETEKVGRVQVFGVSADFWRFADRTFSVQENEVFLNEKLAAALGVGVGDEVSLRIEKPSLLPRSAPLAAQNDPSSIRARFVVKRVLGADELGRFSLSANQVVPYNAFVNFKWLGEQLDRAGKANLVVSAEPVSFQIWEGEEFGFRMREVDGTVQLESERVYLDSEAVRAAQTIPNAEQTLTYLISSVSLGENSTPYSFAVAKENTDLDEDEIIINRWLADELEAEVDDEIELAYAELGASDTFVEQTRTFVVREIVEMSELEPERLLALHFPGLSGVDRCVDWDTGIPMDEELVEDYDNELYWERYGQTPKVMVSLSAGQEMWANRFGGLTSVRWEKEYECLAPTPADRMALFCEAYNPVDAGFVFQPVGEQALAAVDQAMDFGQLFVGMSFFLIVAALMLTGLLFVFGIQKRAEEMGILLSLGWTARRVRLRYLAEAGVIALIGSLAGAWAGTGYTRLLIWGLSRYWQGAIANSAIHYFAKAETVCIGAVASFVCAMVAIAVAMWRQSRHPARELLMADFSQEERSGNAGGKKGLIFAGVCIVAAFGVIGYARSADLQSVTMPFFGAGALLLLAGILGCRSLIPLLRGVALRNVARRRGRSLTVIGLLACGCFMVFAVSSMKEDVTAHAEEKGSGTGGFLFFGESTLPIAERLGGVRLRVHDGDDASCLNLNRAQSPRLLGVDPEVMSARQAFLKGTDLWQLLQQELPDGAVPALAGDADTMMWGLEKKVGDRLVLLDELGQEFTVELVGMLPMRLSVFQGSLLISEMQFTERFPAEAGWRMFLMDRTFRIAAPLMRAGLDIVPSTDRLNEFYAVESTYLAMFLVLGALGLMVGSMGMGVVVLRNIQDRRAEVALLRAVGYRDCVLRKQLFVEHGVLLVAGIGVGVLASAVAMVPAWTVSQSQASVGFLGALLLAVAGSGLICMMAAIHISLRGDALRGLRSE
jgi:ABC-type lipoprotein release transport system permease subunit